MVSDGTVSIVDDPGPARRIVAEERLIAVLNAARPLEQPASFALAEIDHVSFGRGAARAVTGAGRRKLRVDLADPGVSGTHATLVRDGAFWSIVDEGSKNGTRVNGHRVTRAPVKPEDLLELGNSFFYVRPSVPPAASAPAALRTFNPSLAERFQVVSRVARSSVPVLLCGESGTGKGVLARAVHELSGLSGPFVVLNCGAIPGTLVESELFGARKGAYSGADADRAGLIAAAHRGTLFLDEIAELAEPSQVALLHVLEEGEVVALGSTKPVKVDVRVVAATHQDLAERVAAGRFRDDLYARLKGEVLTLPPLRGRREDLGLLCAELLPRVAGARAASITFQREAARALIQHDWPHNIRELEHVLARALALLDRDELRLEHLPLDRPREAVAQEREQLRELVQSHRGNVSAMARALGTSRSQVRRLLARHDLDLPRAAVPDDDDGD